jgi:hypothetical protein
VFDLDVLRAGVPDDAFKPVTGDDKNIASEIKKRNRADAKALFRYSIQENIDRIAGAFAAIADLPETTPDEVHAKETAYAGLHHGDDWERAKCACDLWTAAFFAPLTKEVASAVLTTRHVWDTIGGRLPQGRVAGIATELARRQPFLHWPVEFPEVSASGGFDVVLGNPPWERIKLSEQEFFATRDAAIADAPNKGAREILINALSGPGASPAKQALAREWNLAKHAAECEGKFLRTSQRFPLTATGDINTYAVFAELFMRACNSDGYAGVILKAGILTDYTYRDF